MARPKKCRIVDIEPDVTYFKPRGIPLTELEEVVLTVDEVEAIKLKDYHGKEQLEASNKMGISQPTFHRLLVSARKKISDAVVNGKSIKIQGGNYKMPGGDGTGPIGGGQGRGLGRGTGRGFGYGGPSTCKCPNCGKEVAHRRGIACTQTKCPKCGTRMIRGHL